MMKYFFHLCIVLIATQTTIAQEVTIQQNDRDSILVISGQNSLPTTVAVHFESKTADLNVKEWHRLPSDGKPHDLFEIAKSKIPADKNINDLVRISYRIGDPGSAKPKKRYRYRYPFATGTSSKIIQGYKGSFSHQEPHSKYAIDFDMAIGDTVYAAREGVVVWLVEHNTEGGRDRSLTDKANEIAIFHEDGTLGYYTHLDHQGALVEIGDQVVKGQAIGICGLTGFTTTPHLHFVVRVIAPDGEPTAIPTFFEKQKGKRLKKGQYARH